MLTLKWLIKNNKICSFELVKAFLWACAFHLFFVFFFRIAKESSPHEVITLPFTHVEVDLGEKKGNFSPISHELVFMFPHENPTLPLFSSTFLDMSSEETWNKKYNQLSQPDFSTFESMPYTPFSGED